MPLSYLHQESETDDELVTFNYSTDLCTTKETQDPNGWI